MFVSIDLAVLPGSDELLTEDRQVPTNAQISQEPGQGAAYRLQTLPDSEELLTEDRQVPTNAQISQEPGQGAAYRLQTVDE